MTSSRKKIILGALTGVAVGIGIGVALSRGELVDELLDSFRESGGKLAVNLKELFEENKHVLNDIKDRLADTIESDMPGPSA